MPPKFDLSPIESIIHNQKLITKQLEKEKIVREAWMGRGGKHYLRKSSDRKTKNIKALISLLKRTEICARRSANFRR